MQTKKNAQEMKDRVDKARSRPLLIESLHSGKEASNLAKLKATKEYIKILEEQGINPKDHLT